MWQREAVLFALAGYPRSQGQAVATQPNYTLPQAPDGVKEFMQMGSLPLARCSLCCNDALSMASTISFRKSEISIYTTVSFGLSLFFLNTARTLMFVRECYGCSGEKGNKIHLVKQSLFSEGRNSTAKCWLCLKITCNYLPHPTVISGSGPLRGTGSHFDSKPERHIRRKRR